MDPLTISAIIGSAASIAGNVYSNYQASKQQKVLNSLKYEDMIRYGRSVGATPSSLVAGVTGNAGGAVPTASSGNNPFGDLGSTVSSAVQSSAAKDNANAALTNAETDRLLALMKLKFEPKKYFADIRKSLSDAFNSTKEAFLYGSMKNYYDELVTDLQKVRPWKIAGLQQSLLNDMAQFEKILQDTKTSRAQEVNFYASAEESRSISEKNYAEAWNEHLRGFRIQWENDLLAAGIDPNKSFWENTGRLMYTNPQMFQRRMNMFISSLNQIDLRLQDNLGDHYKRNIAIGYGLYKLNDLHQKNANARSYRNSNAIGAISKMIPFLGGSSTPNYVLPNDDYFDFYNR